MNIHISKVLRITYKQPFTVNEEYMKYIEEQGFYQFDIVWNEGFKCKSMKLCLDNKSDEKIELPNIQDEITIILDIDGKDVYQRFMDLFGNQFEDRKLIFLPTHSDLIDWVDLKDFCGIDFYRVDYGYVVSAFSWAKKINHFGIRLLKTKYLPPSIFIEKYKDIIQGIKSLTCSKFEHGDEFKSLKFLECSTFDSLPLSGLTCVVSKQKIEIDTLKQLVSLGLETWVYKGFEDLSVEYDIQGLLIVHCGKAVYGKQTQNLVDLV